MCVNWISDARDRKPGYDQRRSFQTKTLCELFAWMWDWLTEQGEGHILNRGLDQKISLNEHCELCLWVEGLSGVACTYCLHQMAHSIAFSFRDATSWKNEEERGTQVDGRLVCLVWQCITGRCRPSVATRRVRTFFKFNMWQWWLSIFPSTRIVRFGPCIWPFRMSVSNFPSLLFGSNTADQVGPHQRSLLSHKLPLASLVCCFTSVEQSPTTKDDYCCPW